MGYVSGTVLVATYCLIVASVGFSGCLTAPVDEPPADETSDVPDAAEGASDEHPGDGPGEATATPAWTDIAVLDGCRGVETFARLSTANSPWDAPPGWERPAPGEVRLRTLMVTCNEAYLFGAAQADNVSIVIEAHNNLHPPVPLNTTYGSIWQVLTLASSHDDVATRLANLTTVLPIQLANDDPRVAVEATSSSASLRADMVGDGDDDFSSSAESVLVISTDPLVYIKRSSVLEADAFALLARLSATPGFETSRLPGAQDGPGALAMANLHGSSSFVFEVHSE